MSSLHSKGLFDVGDNLTAEKLQDFRRQLRPVKQIRSGQEMISENHPKNTEISQIQEQPVKLLEARKVVKVPPAKKGILSVRQPAITRRPLPPIPKKVTLVEPSPQKPAPELETPPKPVVPPALLPQDEKPVVAEELIPIQAENQEVPSVSKKAPVVQEVAQKTLQLPQSRWKRCVAAIKRFFLAIKHFFQRLFSCFGRLKKIKIGKHLIYDARKVNENKSDSSQKIKGRELDLSEGQPLRMPHENLDVLEETDEEDEELELDASKPPSIFRRQVDEHIADLPQGIFATFAHGLNLWRQAIREDEDSAIEFTFENDQKDKTQLRLDPARGEASLKRKAPKKRKTSLETTPPVAPSGPRPFSPADLNRKQGQLKKVETNDRSSPHLKPESSKNLGSFIGPNLAWDRYLAKQQGHSGPEAEVPSDSEDSDW